MTNQEIINVLNRAASFVVDEWPEDHWLIKAFVEGVEKAIKTLKERD